MTGPSRLQRLDLFSDDDKELATLEATRRPQRFPQRQESCLFY